MENNFQNLPIDILIIICQKLNPIEAKTLSMVNNKFLNLYKYIKMFNEYLPIKNNLENIKKQITQGYRYLIVNNEVLKIINILEFYPPGFNLILDNGYILQIKYNYCNIFNYKKFNKKININQIYLITNSKFKYKMKPIKFHSYY
jgi:hypothetical protein